MGLRRCQHPRPAGHTATREPLALPPLLHVMLPPAGPALRRTLSYRPPVAAAKIKAHELRGKGKAELEAQV